MQTGHQGIEWESSLEIGDLCYNFAQERSGEWAAIKTVNWVAFAVKTQEWLNQFDGELKRT